MKKWQKTLCSSLALLLFTTEICRASDLRAGTAITAQGEVAIRTEDLPQIIDDAADALTNLNEIVDDLRSANDSAKKAIVDQSADRIYATFKNGFDVIQVILADTKLTENEKFDAVAKLAGVIGQVYFSVVRHQGEDSLLLPPRYQTPVNLMKQGRVAEGVKLAFSVGRTFAREYVLDVKAALTYKVSAEDTAGNSQKIWSFLERIKRDQLTQKLTLEIDQFAENSYSKLPEDSEMAKAFLRSLAAYNPDEDINNTENDGNFRFDKGRSVLEKSKLIRTTRISSQKFAFMGLVGISMLAFFTPLTNISSILSQESTLISPTIDGILFAAPLIALSLIKLKSAFFSGRTAELIEATAQKFQTREFRSKLTESGRTATSRIKRFFSRKPNTPVQCSSNFKD